MLGVIYHDMDRIMHALQSLAIISEETDKTSQTELAAGKVLQYPSAELAFGQVMYDSWRYPLNSRSFFLRNLPFSENFITLEGLITDLEPNFSIAEIIAPLVRNLAPKIFPEKDCFYSLSASWQILSPGRNSSPASQHNSGKRGRRQCKN